NFILLNKFGVQTKDLKYFLPPYEWYNLQISKWSADRKMQLINFTPGIGTNADYTTPDLANYKTSKELTERLMKFELANPDKLNGAIVLIHLGTHPDRKDKFYNSLDQIINILSKKGYTFKALP
ncbi:MAG TPA: cellulase, partial [Prolixibacteraceae bacterium]